MTELNLKQITDRFKFNIFFCPCTRLSKPWPDEELYAKYNLIDEEIMFIESMIKPMG